MLIDKEKIQLAKEKLGERNAELIAQAMNLQQYDERNHKSLCPFHTEDTPSFVFNPKKNSFHCFGCGKNMDIIDAYMASGNTYVESVRRLFTEADVKYSFGEHRLKDRHDYRYPVMHEVQRKDIMYKYMIDIRKISKETLDYCGVSADERGNVVFPFYDTNDVLKVIKYRPAKAVKKGDKMPKSWVQHNTDSQPLLFNMNRINVTEPLIITEGEIDCLSVIECGYKNCVSVPFGAQNHHWIEENWDWLEQFDSIILCPDSDEPGQKMVKEITPRLGSWRVKVVDLPTMYKDPKDGKDFSLKDANEVLRAFGKEGLNEAVRNAKDTPIPSAIDFSDIEDVDINDLDGIHIGIKPLDEHLMKLFYGTLTIVSGTPGSGKTSFLYQLICNSIDEGVNAWVYSRELSGWLSRNWFMHILAGKDHVETNVDGYSGSVTNTVPKDIKRKISEHYQGRLMFYRDDYPNDYQSILNAMIDTRRKNGARTFLIDNLMTVDLKGDDNNKYERQTMFCNELIQFAVKYDACVILVAHPRKLLDPNADIGLYDVSGSGNLVNLTHRYIGLRRVSPQEKQGVLNRTGDGYSTPPNKYDVVASIIKDRMRGNAGKTVGIYYDVPSRRFYTNRDEYFRQYNWVPESERANQKRVGYPHDAEDIEAFGEIE